jgi:hypothetical protein
MRHPADTPATGMVKIQPRTIQPNWRQLKARMSPLQSATPCEGGRRGETRHQLRVYDQARSAKASL